MQHRARGVVVYVCFSRGGGYTRWARVPNTPAFHSEYKDHRLFSFDTEKELRYLQFRTISTRYAKGIFSTISASKPGGDHRKVYAIYTPGKRLNVS